MRHNIRQKIQDALLGVTVDNDDLMNLADMIAEGFGPAARDKVRRELQTPLEQVAFFRELVIDKVNQEVYDMSPAWRKKTKKELGDLFGLIKRHPFSNAN